MILYLCRFSNESTPGDIYDALAFGARLTTRPGVGKVMIAMTCDTITSGWNYGDAITMLKEGLIKLHYINPKKLALKYSDKKLKTKIYGYNKQSVFTIKNLNSPDGDKSYRSQLKIPKVLISVFITYIHFLYFVGLYLNISYRIRRIRFYSRNTKDVLQR